MDSYRWFVLAHVGAGTLALATFWIAAFLRKGSPRHRRTGQVYLLAMLGVIASGVPLSLAMIERGRPATAMFLGFLLLLTATGCINAWRAIRLRGDRRRHFGAMFWILVLLNAIAGIGIIVLGVHAGSVLFQVFGGVGVFFFVNSVQRWRKAPDDPLWWLREHYGAMIGNGVATHIAFFSIGLRNALPGLDPAMVQHFAWFAPLAAAVIAATWLDRRYRRRGPGPRPAPTASPGSARAA